MTEREAMVTMIETADPGDLANWPESIARMLRAGWVRWARSLRNRIVVNAKDGSVLVRIPAGRFKMGDGTEKDCPEHEVELGEYWIGVYCVTNGQYARFLEETGHRPPDTAEWGEPVWKAGQCPRDRMEHPVVCVSWDDARAYCEWAGGDLPTEAEWEKAARGPLGLIYPWGNGWDVVKCRSENNRGSEQAAVVWRYAEGASGYGTYQQSGNVWEWCRDWYDNDYYSRSARRDPVGLKLGAHRVLRGGSWYRDVPASCRAAFRYLGAPACRFVTKSFRFVRTV